MNTLLQFKFIKASIEELHNIAHKTIFNIHPKPAISIVYHSILQKLKIAQQITQNL